MLVHIIPIRIYKFKKWINIISYFVLISHYTPGIKLGYENTKKCNYSFIDI